LGGVVVVVGQLLEQAEGGVGGFAAGFVDAGGEGVGVFGGVAEFVGGVDGRVAGDAAEGGGACVVDACDGLEFGDSLGMLGEPSEAGGADLEHVAEGDDGVLRLGEGHREDMGRGDGLGPVGGHAGIVPRGLVEAKGGVCMTTKLRTNRDVRRH